MGRPLAVLLAALLAFPAHAERADRAGFTQSQKAAAGLEGWPQWSRVEVWTTGTAGDEDGLFHGKLSLKWMLDIDAGGFYLGDAPVLADINGDGRDDLVVIQYFPTEGWRLLVAEIGLNGIEYLTQTYFAHKPDLLVLHGAADLDSDGVQEIVVSGRFAGEDALLLYHWRDGELVQAGPFAGFGPGPADAGARLRVCADRPAFLASHGDPAGVVGVTPGAAPDEITYAKLAETADAAGFAAARSCP